MPQKKPFILSRFAPYMGGKQALLYLSLALSALSAALTVAPFVLVWWIVRSVLSPVDALGFTSVTAYAWWALGLAVAGIAVYFAALVCSHFAAFEVEVELQKRGMARVMHKPLGYFDEHSSGKIRKVINDGAGATHTFIAHHLPDLAAGVVSPLIVLVLLFVVEWRMGLASLVPIAIAFALMVRMMGTGSSKRFQERYVAALEEMSSEAVEYVRAIPVVKTFGQSIHSFKRFYASIVNYRDDVFKYALAWRFPMSLFYTVMQATAFFLIPVVLLMLRSGAGAASVIADYVFYLLIAPVFAGIFMRSAHFGQNAMVAEMALDRVEAVLDYPDLPEAEVGPGARSQAAAHDVEFRAVTFTYPGAESPALRDVSFTLREGQTLALVGPSGGGKTTIARLAARFWDCDEGEVLVGGVNVKRIPKEELMDRISIVFQNAKLFKGSLRENILFGNAAADERQLQRAVDLSQSREIVEGQPEGLETLIGSKGTYLSGGEQQRIAIARAMVKDAPIVVLDEATAFADPENEHLIQRGLRELSKGKTTLMIAHRLTSVADVDAVLVVEGGRIVEAGDHESLLARGGLYRRMWEEYQQSISWRITAHTDAPVEVEE